MAQPIGVAVVGAGRWGTHLVRNFLQHPDAQLLAIADPNRERLDNLQVQFSLDHQSPTPVLATDWSALTQVPGVEAVAIATPAATHYSLIKDALMQGYHVLAEKPLTLNPSESLALCQLATQHNRQLVVDQTYLFNPAIATGREIVQSGQLGSLRYGYAARTHLGPVRSDVDALWDLAIHDIAIVNDWLGQMPVQVEARGTVWLQPTAGDRSLFPQGLSDLVWATITYPNGFQLFIHVCWLNPDKQRRLCLVGSDAALIFDELSPTPLTLQWGTFAKGNDPSHPSAYNPTHQRCEVLSFPHQEPLRQVCDHFLDCIRSDRSSAISSGWLGADLVKVMAALTTSLNQQGQIVQIGQP